MSADTNASTGLRAISLYRKAYGAYTPQVVLIVVLAVVSSILEGLGISSIIPVFSFVGGGAGSATDTISQMIAGLFGLLHVPFTFRMLPFFFGGLFIALGLLTRLAAFFGIADMIGAWTFSHLKKGIIPILNGGELSALFFSAFLILLVWGTKKWGLDNVFFKRK